MHRSPNQTNCMKTKLFVLTTAAALSCGTYALLAQDAPPPPPAGGEGRPPGGEARPGGPPQGGGDRLAEFIKRADADADGKISKEEFVNSTKKESEDRFSKLDTNTDGFADKAEIEEAGRKMREMAQRRPDGEGGPGGFRRPEGGENMRRPEGQGPDGFRRPEGGGDGTRPRPGQGDSQPGNPPGPGGEGGFRRPGGEGGRPQGAGMMGDMLQRMDKNSDGSVTKEEYMSSTEERFAQMDENKDGKITKEEVEAMGRKMREMMGAGGRPGGEGGEGGFRRPEGGDGGRPRPEGGNRPDGERPKRPEGDAPAPPKDA